MYKKIDLHSHTVHSDGTYTVKGIINYALKKGLSALSITDHDTTEGIAEAIKYAKNFPNFELVPGIELSTNEKNFSPDIHILGYYFDYKDKNFINKLKEIISGRDSRNLKMIEKMRADGLDVNYDDILALSDDGVITRSHFCRWLVKNGHAKSINDGFDRFLGNDKKYYVRREKVTCKMAIELIHSAGGFTSLAHPILYKLNDKKLEELVSKLKDYGLDGIETYYTTYSEKEHEKIRQIAQKYDLIMTGGSDFHGANKENIDLASGYGNLVVPYEVLENIKKKLGR